MPLPEEAQNYIECFSKFEYALMESGYHKLDGECDACNRKGFLTSDWNTFKKNKLPTLTLQDLKNISADTRYIIEQAPQKRIINDQGKPDWRDVSVSSVSDAIDACKRVRNNLVHGGKYNDEKADRNRKLLKGATDIIRKLTEYDTNLKNCYDDAQFLS